MLPDLLHAHAERGEPGLPLSGSRWLTAWSFEVLPLVGIALVAVIYLLGVHRLRSAGHAWPLGRSIAFLGGGLGSLLVATASSLATYDTVLISVHMIQHMVLAMLVPIFLALGAPITLALRTLPARPRAALLAVIHSRIAAVLTFPVVAGAIFVINPFVLYFSGLYEATLENPWLHDANHLHFIAIGCLWFWPLLGIDPMPRRIGYPMRVIAVFLTLPFHAFLGVAIMSMNTLIAADWYLAHDREWGLTPLEDQERAGGILWVSGDLVGLVVVAVLFVGWVRASEREARREDRRLDRLDAMKAARASVASTQPSPSDRSDQ